MYIYIKFFYICEEAQESTHDTSCRATYSTPT